MHFQPCIAQDKFYQNLLITVVRNRFWYNFHKMCCRLFEANFQVFSIVMGIVYIAMGIIQASF